LPSSKYAENTPTKQLQPHTSKPKPLRPPHFTKAIAYTSILLGFAFIKMLFPSKLPIATSSENLDTIERVALSLDLSIALVPIVGLILNYTPWGIRLTPITLSLLALTTFFASE
jgi:uncharacterized membrane protein